MLKNIYHSTCTFLFLCISLFQIIWGIKTRSIDKNSKFLMPRSPKHWALSCDDKLTCEQRFENGVFFFLNNLIFTSLTVKIWIIVLLMKRIGNIMNYKIINEGLKLLIQKRHDIHNYLNVQVKKFTKVLFWSVIFEVVLILTLNVSKFLFWFSMMDFTNMCS